MATLQERLDAEKQAQQLATSGLSNNDNTATTGELDFSVITDVDPETGEILYPGWVTIDLGFFTDDIKKAVTQLEKIQAVLGGPLTFAETYLEILKTFISTFLNPIFDSIREVINLAITILLQYKESGLSAIWLHPNNVPLDLKNQILYQEHKDGGTKVISTGNVIPVEDIFSVRDVTLNDNNFIFEKSSGYYYSVSNSSNINTLSLPTYNLNVTSTAPVLLNKVTYNNKRMTPEKYISLIASDQFKTHIIDEYGFTLNDIRNNISEYSEFLTKIDIKSYTKNTNNSPLFFQQTLTPSEIIALFSSALDDPGDQRRPITENGGIAGGIVILFLSNTSSIQTLINLWDELFNSDSFGSVLSRFFGRPSINVQDYNTEIKSIFSKHDIDEDIIPNDNGLYDFENLSIAETSELSELIFDDDEQCDKFYEFLTKRNLPNTYFVWDFDFDFTSINNIDEITQSNFIDLIIKKTGKFTKEPSKIEYVLNNNIDQLKIPFDDTKIYFTPSKYDVFDSYYSLNITDYNKFTGSYIAIKYNSSFNKLVSLITEWIEGTKHWVNKAFTFGGIKKFKYTTYIITNTPSPPTIGTDVTYGTGQNIIKFETSTSGDKTVTLKSDFPRIGEVFSTIGLDIPNMIFLDFPKNDNVTYVKTYNTDDINSFFKLDKNAEYLSIKIWGGVFNSNPDEKYLYDVIDLSPTTTGRLLEESVSDVEGNLRNNIRVKTKYYIHEYTCNHYMKPDSGGFYSNPEDIGNRTFSYYINNIGDKIYDEYYYNIISDAKSNISDSIFSATGFFSPEDYSNIQIPTKFMNFNIQNTFKTVSQAPDFQFGLRPSEFFGLDIAIDFFVNGLRKVEGLLVNPVEKFLNDFYKPLIDLVSALKAVVAMIDALQNFILSLEEILAMSILYIPPKDGGISYVKSKLSGSLDLPSDSYDLTAGLFLVGNGVNVNLMASLLSLGENLRSRLVDLQQNADTFEKWVKLLNKEGALSFKLLNITPNGTTENPTYNFDTSQNIILTFNYKISPIYIDENLDFVNLIRYDISSDGVVSNTGTSIKLNYADYVINNNNLAIKINDDTTNKKYEFTIKSNAYSEKFSNFVRLSSDSTSVEMTSKTYVFYTVDESFITSSTSNTTTGGGIIEQDDISINIENVSTEFNIANNVYEVVDNIDLSENNLTTFLNLLIKFLSISNGNSLLRLVFPDNTKIVLTQDDIRILLNIFNSLSVSDKMLLYQLILSRGPEYLRDLINNYSNLEIKQLTIQDGVVCTTI